MKLVENGSDWKKWVFLLQEEVFFLERADHAEKDFYEVPGYKDEKEINWHQVEKFKFKKIPERIKLSISNTGKIINAPVTYAFMHKEKGKENYKLEIYWTVKLNSWDSTQNPVFVQRKMIEIHENSVQKEKIELIEDSDSGVIDIYFTFNHDGEEIIGSALREAKAYIEELQSKAVNAIANKESTGLTVNFEFRPDIQGACSRYLTYFIEFLRDLGIETNSDFKRKGNEILFSIEPTDKETSLEKIKEALAFYLAIPEENGDISIKSPGDPILELKIERLNSEVQALKSNIKIFETLMQIQGAKISEHHSENSLGAGKTPIEGLKSVTTPSGTESKLEFFNGFIRLGKFQKFGLEFDWSAIKWLPKK